jgi:hypothetical protein
MSNRQIIVINSPNSLVTDADVRLMVSACNTLIGQVVAAWTPGNAVDIMFHADMIAAKVDTATTAQRFFIVDDPQGMSNALAMHDERDIKPAGFIFTRSILNNNGVALCDNANLSRPTVATALFKAIAESIVNPTRNLWWNDPICGEFIAAKICDPVESTPVTITITITPAVAPAAPVASTPVVEQEEKEEKTFDIKDALYAIDTGKPEYRHPEARVEVIEDPAMPALVDASPDASLTRPPVPEPAPEPIKFNVALCNFVLPAWSNPSAPDGSRFDFGNTLKHPFQVGIGGCCSKYDSQPGVIPRILFDRQVPGWKRELTKANYISFNAFRG